MVKEVSVLSRWLWLGSSKSYHVALKIILKLLQEKRTALVVRAVYGTHKDSTFSLLSEIIEDLGLGKKVKRVKSPFEIMFPNGSNIIFRGLDDREKLKSVNNVSLIWMEESSEASYEAFKELIGRLRHPSLDLHMILSTNPVSKTNWTYKHFIFNKDTQIEKINEFDLYKQKEIYTNDTYYMHSTADDNLFLPNSYKEQLDDIKNYDEDLYRVARLGQFGTNGTKVLPQFETLEHSKVMAAIDDIKKPMLLNGMDFGFVSSYNALIRVAIDHDEKIMYIYDEYYKKGQTDDITAIELEEYKHIRITADSAEPKTIQYFRQQGFNMVPATKFPGSRLQNTKKVKRFKKIICSTKCTNTADELSDLTYKIDKNGDMIEDEFNIDPHTFSAIWYALDKYQVSDLKGNAIRTFNRGQLGI